MSLSSGVAAMTAPVQQSTIELRRCFMFMGVIDLRAPLRPWAARGMFDKHQPLWLMSVIS
jgi:hypothetical protein